MKRFWEVFKIFIRLKKEEIGDMMKMDVLESGNPIIVIPFVLCFFAFPMFVLFPLLFISLSINFGFYPFITKFYVIDYGYYMFLSVGFCAICALSFVLYIGTVHPFLIWLWDNWKRANRIYNNNNNK